MIRTVGNKFVGNQSVNVDSNYGYKFRAGGKIKIGPYTYGVRLVERGKRGVIPARVYLSCPLVFDVPRGTEVEAS